MKKLFFAISLIGLISLIRPIPTVFAQTDPATPIATDSQTLLNQTYEEVLQKAKDNAKQTEAVLNKKADQNRLVGFAGTISEIKQGAFSLDSGDTTIQVSHGSATTIVKEGLPLKPEQLAVGTSAIVIGTLTPPDVLIAKRVVVYTAPAAKFTKKTILSPILKIDQKKKMLTLKIEDKNREVGLGDLVKIDLSKLTISQKVFGIVMINSTTGSASLIRAKIISSIP